jgi:hypothetical protein
MVIAGLGRAAGLVMMASVAVACSSAGARERDFVLEKLKALPDVDRVHVSCNDGLWSARSDVCATVVMKDGKSLTFQSLGFESFGPARSRVRVAQAGGRAVHVVSCQSAEAFVDVDRRGLVGHHFFPPISGVVDAIRVHKDVIEELEFWPECPQFWEVQDMMGVNRRYCAHAARKTAPAPPLPECP